MLRSRAEPSTSSIVPSKRVFSTPLTLAETRIESPSAGGQLSTRSHGERFIPTTGDVSWTVAGAVAAINPPGVPTHAGVVAAISRSTDTDATPRDTPPVYTHERTSCTLTLVPPPTM